MAIDESLSLTTNNQTPTTSTDMKTQFAISIKSDHTGNVTTLGVILHTSLTIDDRQISESALYRYARADLYPDRVHHEMELTKETVKLLVLPRPSIIHAVLGQNGRYFICYPNKMETEDEAERIFRIWALGTTASMIMVQDVLLQYFTPGISAEDFADIMGEKYGLSMGSFVSIGDH